MTAGTEDMAFAALVESDIASGHKRTTADLAKYVDVRFQQILAKSVNWRHRESRTVYKVRGAGLACTGSGKLMLMVHYSPVDELSENVVFERVHSLFLEKFDPVHATTVWERS